MAEARLVYEQCRSEGCSKRGDYEVLNFMGVSQGFYCKFDGQRKVEEMNAGSRAEKRRASIQ